MSRIRLVVVLTVPFVFAALPLVSLAFGPGSGPPEPWPTVVTVTPPEVAPGPRDTVVQLPAASWETEEAVAQSSEALAYSTGPERDCSQWSNPHIDG